MNNKVVILIVVIFLAVCACAALIGLGGAALFLTSDDVQSQITSMPLLATVEAFPLSATPLASNGNVPQDTASQMDEIQRQVETIRGLHAVETLDRNTMSPDELRKQVEEDFFKDYSAEDARKDNVILSTFGLLDPKVDLYQLFVDIYSEQISGYYDNTTKSMFVIQGEEFLGTERMTYAHEFTHALQDQTYDIENGLNYNDETCKQDTEYCAAVQSLMEGDATLTEENWFSQYATAQDLKDVQNFYQNYQSPVYDSAPDFLQEDFMFPYSQGYDFVQSLYQSGGYAAVDQAYLNPPVSTEQIMHPERYPADQPVKVSLPDIQRYLGAGWEELDNNTLGEWYTYLLLAYGEQRNARLNQDVASEAAEGWGGDQYVIYEQTQSHALVLVLRQTWDSAADAQEYQDAFLSYAQKRWNRYDSNANGIYRWSNTPDGEVRFIELGNDTIWLIAPDTSLTDQILNLFPENF